MKRLVSLMLALLILVSLVPTTVFATGEDATASSGGENLVMLEISLSGYPEANTIGLMVNSQVDLELDEAKSKWNLDGTLGEIVQQSTNQYKAVWGDDEQADVNKKVLSLVFALPLDNADITEANFTYEVKVKKDSEELEGGEISAKVVLNLPLDQLTLDRQALEMDLSIGITETLVAQVQPADYPGMITWSSSDETVAVVHDGVVTPKGVGTATITVKAGDKSASCDVTVVCTHDCATKLKGEKAPDCTEKGYTGDRCCAACGEVLETGKEIAANGHSYTDVVTDPTCTEKGYTTHTCACGDVVVDTYVDALGHTGGTATCVAQAICERCETAYGELDATNHGETEIRDVKEPNCSEQGNTGNTYCTDCGQMVEAGQVLPIKHAYVDTVVDATYTKPGYTEHVCSLCGDTYQDAQTKAKGLPEPVIKAEANPATGGGILRWEHDGEADSYKVYRKTSSKGKYKLLATVTEPELKVSVSVGKKYYYKVYAVCNDNSKLSSGYSNVVTVTGKCAAPVVTVTANASSGKPYLKWGKVSSAKKYYVYRLDEATGALTSLGSTTKTYFTDSKAAVGTTYTYQVRAYPSKSTYKGALSEPVSCLCVCGQPAVSISISSATGKPTLSWKAVSGAVSYDVYRSTNGTDFELLVNQTAVSYADTAASPDTDYWYKVNAIAAEEANNSAEAAAKKVHTTLAQPKVTFGNDEKTGKPKLTWEEVEGATSYKIYRSSYSKKSYKAIKTVTGTEYTDTSVKVAKGYYYKVIAVGANAKSAYSSYKKVYGKCAQPDVTATVNSSGKPYLKWGKVTSAKKYYVYRVDEAGNLASLGSTTKTYFTDSKAAVGTTYTYQVRAYPSKSTYKGAYSEADSCLCILGQPTVTVGTVAATGKPTVKWSTVSGAVSYELYRSENGGEYQLVDTAGAMSYTDEAAVLDSQYSYKVIAIGEEAVLNRESAEKTIICACGNATITGSLNGKKPMVAWEPVEGATKYYVYRSTKKSSGYKKVATVEGESYTDKKASKGKTYYYKVIAVSENTSSAYSNYVKIKSK